MGPVTAECFAFVNSCLLENNTTKKHVNSAFQTFGIFIGISLYSLMTLLYH